MLFRTTEHVCTIEVRICVVKDFENNRVTFACISLKLRLYIINGLRIVYTTAKMMRSQVPLLLSYSHSSQHLFHFPSICESMSVCLCHWPVFLPLS